jgi:probable rRNA maturation factor
MSPEVEIVTISGLWRDAPGIKKRVREAIRASVTASGVVMAPSAEVSVQLSDDSNVRALNARWRGIDRPTNVLSFPAVDAGAIGTSPLLGDIVVAFETVTGEALEEGKSFADHFSHLIVHGFLHLLGFDHQTAGQAEHMEALEVSALSGLGIANPYVATDLLETK